MEQVVGGSTDRNAAPPLPIRGRDTEVAAVADAVARVAEGQPGIVLIEGGAGLGKSRLLVEAAAEARRRGVGVTVSGADPDDRDSRYALLLAALATGDAPVLSRSELASLRELRDQRYWFLIELEAAIARAATSSGLVIALDDVQWADGSTLDAVRTLTGHLGSLPILWVLAFRPRHDSVALARLVAELDHSTVTRLELGPLSPEAVREVLADHTDVVDERLVAIAARAEGIPFYLVDLLRGLTPEDLDDRAGGEPVHPMEGVAQRLMGLTAAAGQVAQVGAVLGRTFRTDDVATMLTVGAPTLMDPFAELVRADVLTEFGDDWAFRHDIVRQTVLSFMAAPMRRSLERDAAEVLLAAGIPPVDIARRLAGVATPGDRRAIDTLLAAARSLVETDPGSAAELGERALRLLPIGDPMRATVAAETVVGLHLAGREADALRLADDAMPDIADNEQYGELQLSIARMYTLPATTRAECGRRGLAATGISDVLRARHLAVLALSEAASGDLDGAAETARAADAMVDATGDPVAELQLEFSRMTLDAATGRYQDALGRIPAIRRLVGRTGDQVPAMGAEWLRANVLVSLDQLEQGWAVSTDALRIARRDRQAWMFGIWDMWQGWFLLQCGRLSEARALLEGALLAEGSPVATALSDATGVAALGRVARHLGDRRLTAWCTNVATRSLALDTDDDARRHLGWFVASQAISDGDAATARSTLELACHGGSLLPVLAVDLGMEVEVVRVARELSDDQLAVGAVEAAVARAASNPDCGSLVASALHTRGLQEGSVDTVREATERYDADARPLLAASAFEDLGCALVSSGDGAGAVAPLSRSLELHARVGSEWDARRLRRRLRDLGVRRRLATRERALSGWASLTPSELAVAALVAQGRSNRDTAEELFVSPNTVSAHLRHIFEKLSITSRVELARIVADQERSSSSG